jgi:hypothetical protein
MSKNPICPATGYCKHYYNGTCDGNKAGPCARFARE